jgi:hypothetical protein
LAYATYTHKTKQTGIARAEVQEVATVDRSVVVVVVVVSVAVLCCAIGNYAYLYTVALFCFYFLPINRIVSYHE